MDIKEFAERIGVSTTTVSSALTGNGRVSEATRQLVLQKAKELGYAPNLHARRLVSGRSYLIALSHMGEELASDLFWLQIARSIVNPLRAQGYDLWLNMSTGRSNDHSRLRQMVRSKTVDGMVLICQPDVPYALLDEFSRSQCPCVVLGNTPIEGREYIGSVTMDLRPGIAELAQTLADLGHRRTGFIDSDLRDRASSYFEDELAGRGIGLRKDCYVVAGSNTAEDGSRALRTLLSRENPPTAILGRTDILAIGAIQEARRMGLSVPGDLSIAGHDDLALLTAAEPGLTTIRLDCEGLAIPAADMLLEMLGGSDTCPAPVTISTALVMRDTIGPPKTR